MIVLDYRDSRPLYQQVKDSLRRMMLTGLLEPDEKLPSVRSLATQLAINPNTIQRAYAELEAEGYIYSVAGISLLRLWAQPLCTIGFLQRIAVLVTVDIRQSLLVCSALPLRGQ